MIFSRIILESTSLRNMTLLTWSIALFQYLLSYSALSCLIGVPEPTHRRMRARLRILCCPSPTGEFAPDSGFYVVPHPQENARRTPDFMLSLNVFIIPTLPC